MAAEEQFAQAALDRDYDRLVENLDHEKFGLAKHITTYESTCQNLERTYAAIVAQQAILEQVAPVLKRVDELKDNLARQLRRTSAGHNLGSVLETPAVKEQVGISRDVEISLACSHNSSDRSGNWTGLLATWINTGY